MQCEKSSSCLVAVDERRCYLLASMEFLHNFEDQKGALSSTVHTFQRIFDKKHKAGEIHFQEGDTGTNSLPSPEHDD